LYNFQNNNLSVIKIDILNGMLKNHVSLFEIIDIDKDKSILRLKDQVTNQIHSLMDINFSLTAEKGMLISTRLIPIQSINMTSGLTFQFQKEKRLKILTDLSIGEKEFFRTIFKLSKVFGIQVNSIET